MKEGKRGPYDSYQPHFTICVDKNALRGGLLDEHLPTLRNLVAEIQDRIPYVRIDETDRDQKAGQRHFEGIKEEYDLLLKREFKTAIKHYKMTSTGWAQYRAKPIGKKPPILRWADENEAETHFVDDPEGVLAELMEDRFDQAKMFDQASRAFDRQVETFAAKARPAFEHANRIDKIDTQIGKREAVDRPSPRGRRRKVDLSDLT